jgi:hypothetical protein
LKIGLGDRLPSTSQKATNVVVHDNYFSFVDSSRGLNGGVPTYRGIIKDGKMIGIAEIKSKDAPFFAIGAWEFHKE